MKLIKHMLKYQDICMNTNTVLLPGDGLFSGDLRVTQKQGMGGGWL